MKKCNLCNTEMKFEFYKDDELWNSGYCSNQCEQTDKMILQADCEQ